MRKAFILLFYIIIVLSSTITTSSKAEEDNLKIAVFVPGVLEGSPTYEMMDAGVRNAAKEADVEVSTIEGGFDQAGWSTKINALASEGQYGLIVSSNPAMSEICAAAAQSYPDQDFLVLDGSGLGGDGVSDVIYNHFEQAFLIGYFAALVSTSDELKNSNPDLTVGMIVGQEYPQMNRQIRPGFEVGLHSVNPDIALEFRVLGNWYDAEKARELAEGLYDKGADVILTIAGGANEGVIAAAKERDAYVLWFDSDGTDIAPGVILASSVIAQERAAEEWTSAWLNGTLERGSDASLGARKGYVDFPLDTKNIERYVPESIIESMTSILDDIRSSALILRGLEG